MPAKSNEEIFKEVISIVKHGAENIGKNKEKVIEGKRLAIIMDDIRDLASELAKESESFAPNRDVARIYALAKFSRQFGTGNCMEQAALAATLLLADGVDCTYAGVATKGMKQTSHAFVIVKKSNGITLGTAISSLGNAAIIDPWLYMKCVYFKQPVKSGVFSSAEHAKILRNQGYAPSLSHCVPISSVF